MEQTLRIMFPVIATYAVVLALIIVVIKRLLLGDTLKAVARIGQAETDIRRKEDTLRLETEQHERDFAARRAAAEEDLTKRREEASRESARQKEVLLEEARREAAAILDKARKNERRLREQLVQEIEGRTIDTAGRLFTLVFSERMTESVNKAFVDELLDALEETDASAMTLDAKDAQFLTSHPMDIGQKLRLQSILRKKFGIDLLVTETIRKELLAGLVIKLGSLEIDGSLKSRFADALVEVRKESTTPAAA